MVRTCGRNRLHVEASLTHFSCFRGKVLTGDRVADVIHDGGNAVWTPHLRIWTTSDVMFQRCINYILSTLGIVRMKCVYSNVRL